MTNVECRTTNVTGLRERQLVIGHSFVIRVSSFVIRHFRSTGDFIDPTSTIATRRSAHHNISTTPFITRRLQNSAGRLWWSIFKEATT